ncbi:MAG TPA: YafY family transcriptional regulator [Chromatiales bacterium]|nr:YafY family transcriptional regulator [Thiotrichales bacterium]HIP68812.1 YafY family transcriptional regulator [Chromatiales bacterium]
MRRADRLFRLVQMLRVDRVITATQLADQLEVSERTIYRDMQDLSLSGIPVVSEPGVGYKLMPGFRLPPLMFDEDEITALLLGARMIKAWTDKTLGKAAQRVIEKVQTVLPDHRQTEMDNEEILVPDFHVDEVVKTRINQLRKSIRSQQKIKMDYVRADGQGSSRVVHPLGLFFWGRVWTLVGWCELRDDFRHFRLDRIQQLEIHADVFEINAGGSLQDYLRQVECENDF